MTTSGSLRNQPTAIDCVLVRFARCARLAVQRMKSGQRSSQCRTPPTAPPPPGIHCAGAIAQGHQARRVHGCVGLYAAQSGRHMCDIFRFGGEWGREGGTRRGKDGARTSAHAFLKACAHLVSGGHGDNKMPTRLAEMADPSSRNARNGNVSSIVCVNAPEVCNVLELHHRGIDGEARSAALPPVHATIVGHVVPSRPRA